MGFFLFQPKTQNPTPKTPALPADYTRLHHMLDAALEAVSFLGNLDAIGLSQNRLVCQAAVRSLEIVGEAAAKISQSYREDHPAIPWPKNAFICG